MFRSVVHCITAGSVAHRYFRLRAISVLNPPNLSLGGDGSGAGVVIASNSLNGEDTIIDSGSAAVSDLRSSDLARQTSDEPDPYVTVWCLKRSLSSSFGSICFGALFVSPVFMISSVMQLIMRVFGSNSATACLCERLSHAIESSYRNVNAFGYTYVMLYGSDFVSASRESWEQFFARGVDEIVGRDKVSHRFTSPLPLLHSLSICS